MIKRTVIAIVLIAATAIIGYSFSTGGMYQSGEQNEQRALAPDFTLRNLDGERITLSELRGKVVLLNFWATWCPPCRKEIPDLSRIHTAYKERGVVVLGVSWDELSPDQIKSFAVNYKVTYQILHGTRSELSQVGRAYAWEGYLPTTYVIDRKGYLQETYIGARNEEFFLESIKPLL